MNRRDVYEYTHGNARIRIVIVSANPYNPRRATYLVIREAGDASASTTAVTLAPADPLRGAIDTTRLRPLVEDNLGARIGRLSLTTMASVDTALRHYLEL